MEYLRHTIRKILLENQSHYDKIIALLVSNDIESIVQGIELADGMGYIEEVNYERDDAFGYTPPTHEWLIKPKPEFLDRFSQLFPKPIDHEDPDSGPIGIYNLGWVERDGDLIRIGRKEIQ